MALTSSGQLKVSEIATEFSDTAPHQLSEFYGASTGVPALGQIGVSDFYGAAASAGGGGGATLLLSKDLTGTQGFTMNTLVPTKDMTSSSARLIPTLYNPSGGNLTPSGSRYYWNDWGGDWFDGWGDFYIYNPATTSASYIQFNSIINGSDGVVYTETQTHHSKTFTIKHGWVAQGIFKLDVQCSDDTFNFSIGMYGNMGSDGSTINEDRQYVASWGNLSYNFNSQLNVNETFFTHFIPKLKSFNDGITLSSNNFTANLNTGISGSDNLAIWSSTLQVGATMYFVKGSNNSTGAMYNWVANDIEVAVSALYDFTTHTFTNATATGAYGPTLANCQTAYSGADFLSSTDYFNVTNGVQYWTVPETATYEFQVNGAQGGNGWLNGFGFGTRIVGTKALTEGDVVALIVGQDGIDQSGTCSGAGGGGGGASTVSYGSSVGTAFTNLIAVAGGGGGGGSTDTYTPLQDATSSSSGGAGYTNSGVSGNNGGDGTIGSGCVQGANGGKGWNSLSSGSPPNPIGGTSNGREGGFGGGGRTNPYCGGGGGGYSGGGGGGLPGCSCNQLGPGLGGGSYTSGLDSLTTSGTHTSSGGQITVTKQ